MANIDFNKEKAYEHFSVSCFNQAWNLIDKKDRTPDEDERMLQLAMSSAWHWSQRTDCKPQNLSIAYWQISRVHALCGRCEEAIRYGKLCLNVSQGEDVDLLALGFAYEALARGEMIARNEAQMKLWLTKANEVAENIPEEDTKKMLLDDLRSIT